MSSSISSYFPYGRQSISEEDIAAWWMYFSPFLQGPVVPAFEQSVVAKVGSLHGLAVNSATSALHIACLALGLGLGDRLWTSPITFVASANCGRYCGADIDFADINPLTGLIDIQALEAKLKIADVEGKLPKILVPVASLVPAVIWHLFINLLVIMDFMLSKMLVMPLAVLSPQFSWFMYIQ